MVESFNTTAMKFNQLLKRKTAIKNYEGGTAFTLSPKMELYTAVVTSSLSANYYENEQQRLVRIRALIKKVDPVFVAQLAIYAREAMYLRSIPVLLVVELAKVHRGDSLVKDAVTRIVKRADEITEVLAYYQTANQRTETKKLNALSKQLQKGLAEAFNRFDEYQFAKYNRKTAVTLKDALFLVHPKAKDDNQQLLFDKIVNDTLDVPYTWETELSALGQLNFSSATERAQAFRNKWEVLINSGKLGYMAVLRNLRNILEARVAKTTVKQVARLLSDAKAVRQSKQLPFRFLSAYLEIKKADVRHAGYIMDALERAIQVSAENISGFDWETSVLLAADVSGSMYQPVSARSKIMCYDVGLVLSMLLRHRSKDVITGIFGTTWKRINLPSNGILRNVQELKKINGEVGYGTNGHLVIEDLIKRKTVVDKVMIFTDLQLWDATGVGASLKQAWYQYKSDIAPQAKLYLFDLLGYGQSPVDMKQRDVYLLAGWSDKVFDVLEALDNRQSAVSQIEEINVLS